jgi:hypothetical protein
VIFRPVNDEKRQADQHERQRRDQQNVVAFFHLAPPAFFLYRTPENRRCQAPGAKHAHGCAKNIGGIGCASRRSVLK